MLVLLLARLLLLLLALGLAQQRDRLLHLHPLFFLTQRQNRGELVADRLHLAVAALALFTHPIQLLFQDRQSRWQGLER